MIDVGMISGGGRASEAVKIRLGFGGAIMLTIRCWLAVRSRMIGYPFLEQVRM